MDAIPPEIGHPPGQGMETETSVREDLACAYQLFSHLGMTDTVFTHLSARVPGSRNFLIVNPYGLMFDEITTSLLVKVDADGIPAQETRWPMNPAGFVIHSAIHMGRPDAHCVMHTHTLAGMTIAAQAGGLLPFNQISMQFIDAVAIYDYEGVASDDNLSERDRLLRNLGEKPCLLMRNLGLLTVGGSIAEAFYAMYYLEQVCRIQVSAQSTGAALSIPPAAVLRRTKAQYVQDEQDAWLVWQAFKRRMDRDQPDHRN